MSVAGIRRRWKARVRGMDDRFVRTRMLFGDEAMERLAAAKVAVFGIGGVGGYVVEGLARSGVGSLVLVDHDKVSESNINRQIIATEGTVGQDKTSVMKRRVLEINPAAEVEERKCFFLPETAGEFDFSEYSYIVDAVDTVTAKLEIIITAKACHVPVISSMGTGNRLDPAKLQVADIYETKICPLAKVMRHELRKRGVESQKVVYSTEEPVIASFPHKVIPSAAFVPSAAGLMIAGEVVKEIIKQ